MRCLIGLVVAWSAIGCGRVECNDIFAPDGFNVTIEGLVWSSGRYVVEATGDDDSAWSCEVDLPAASDGAEVCTEGADLTLSGTLSEIVGFEVTGGAPDMLELVLTIDGAVLVEESFTPTYALDEPRGEGCGERRRGFLELSF